MARGQRGPYVVLGPPPAGAAVYGGRGGPPGGLSARAAGSVTTQARGGRRVMRPCSNFWIEKDGKVVLSEWRVALLEAVEQTGSINAAAAHHGIPFRVAWRKIQEMEDGLGVLLTERSTGGPHGGGTRLTAAGRAYIAQFHTAIAGLKERAEQQFRAVFGAE